MIVSLCQERQADILTFILMTCMLVLRTSIQVMSKQVTERKKMTRVAEALAARVEQLGLPLITDYRLFLELWSIYREGKTKYLRSNLPARENFHSTRHHLRQAKIIDRDSDYPRLWRVLAKGDVAAEEAVCLADSFCYISHLSAMQRYGLTNRRPESLFITQPKAARLKELIRQKARDNFGEYADDPEIFIQPFYRTHHPRTVRSRPVDPLATRHYGDWRKVRGSFSRIASVGQTFLDTIEAPERCGGMLHVLEAWEEHSQTYREEIIARVNASPQPIHKVRAGYILEERLGLNDPRIEAWLRFAQRGSSRVLDPGAPFAENHSERWMLSINVG